MGRGLTSVRNARTSVGHQRAGARQQSRMGGGIHRIASPSFFAVLVEDEPFAVADAVGASRKASSWPFGPPAERARGVWTSSSPSVGARSPRRKSLADRSAEGRGSRLQGLAGDSGE